MSERKLILIRTVIIITSLLVVIFTFEFYLRHSSTYVIKQQTRSRPELVESNFGHFSMNTPKGRRLVANAHVLIRNHNLSGRDILMDINSQGFRDSQIPKNKKNNELRILILGDSITLADYLQVDEVYVERIEKYLRESIKSQNINVINAGVNDIGLKEEIDILTGQGLAIEPDIVIIAFYLNDSRSPWGFSGEYGRRGGLFIWLRSHSLLAKKFYDIFKLSRFIKDNRGKERLRWTSAQSTLDWADDRKDFLKLVSMAKYDWGAAWQVDSWDIIDKELNKLELLSRDHNFDVVVTIFPVSFQVYTKFIDDTPQQILQEKVIRLGFGYLDLLPILRSHRDEDLYFDHCHLKEKANDIIGKAIASFIKREMLSELN